MYQFTGWCLLCASEKNVEVEIQQLDDAMRENVGQFSLIVSFIFLFSMSNNKLLFSSFLESHAARSSIKDLQILSQVSEKL
jgi:hypothetical protein